MRRSHFNVEDPKENRESVVINDDIPDPIAIQMEEYRCKQKENWLHDNQLRKFQSQLEIKS